MENIKCDKCDSDYAEHYFKDDETGKILCEDCMFNLDGVRKETVAVGYFVDGEFIGDTTEYSTYELLQSIADNKGYTKIEAD